MKLRKLIHGNEIGKKVVFSKIEKCSVKTVKRMAFVGRYTNKEAKYMKKIPNATERM